MARLNFEEIWKNLKEIGVTMQITQPYEYKKEGYDYIERNSQIDEAVLATIKNKDRNIILNKIDKKIYEKRLDETIKSLKEKPYHFGPYK